MTLCVEDSLDLACRDDGGIVSDEPPDDADVGLVTNKLG